MKQIAIMLLLAISASYAYSQTQQQQNLEKYWRYRDRFREKFIVVSQNVEEEGVNIPCGYLFDNKNLVAKFSDGNYNMSHYLSVLSTELYMLKKNGQDYSETLKELYYAMLAMERLDLYSESHWEKFKGDRLVNNATEQEDINANETKIQKGSSISILESEYMPTDINNFNGMHLRDDITHAFWKKYKTHFGSKSSFQSCYTGGKHPLEEISQDVMYHNIEGLSLVAKLVGVENVSIVPAPNFKAKGSDGKYLIPKYLEKQGIKSGNNINFSLWAKDFIKRYIKWFQSDKGEGLVASDVATVLSLGVTGLPVNYWVLRNSVTKKPVQEGSGIEGGPDAFLFYSEGLISVGKNIVGENLRSKPTLVNGLFGELFVNHLTRIEDVVAITIGTQASPLLEIVASVAGIPLGTITVSSPTWSKKIAEAVIDGIVFDDYKVRSLACTGNYSGKNTFLYLQKNCQTYSPKGAPFPIYEHFGLMNLVLYDLDMKACNWMSYNGSPLITEVNYKIIQLQNDNTNLYQKIAEARLKNNQNAINEYNMKINENNNAITNYRYYLSLLNYENYSSNKTMYENLLNSAPVCGPTSKDNYVKDWSTVSRLIWPESNGKEDPGEFCGMDYMVLYNLYCIAFSREQYVTTTNNTSTINTVVISKPITSNNVTNSAPCVTLLPGFEASGSRNYTAKAVALPSDFVDGTQYRKIDYPDCGCNYLTKNKSLATTSNSNTVRKTMSYMANKSNLSEDNEGKDVFGIDQEEQPITTIENDESEDENPIDLCSEQLSVSVAPNPASDVLQLEVDNYKELPIIVDIVSLDGNSKQSLELYEPYARIDVNGWSSGIYIVRVKSGGVLVSQMVMVKH